MHIDAYSGTLDAFGKSLEIEYERGRLTIAGLSPSEARAIVDALESKRAGVVLRIEGA